jgi:hypothetical protein
VSRFGLAALALALVQGSPRAFAQPEVPEAKAQPVTEEAIRFRYEAPPECPAADVFTARVRQRTSRGREAASEELARTFTISIGAAVPGFLGKIEFLDDAGAPVSRRVHGEECDAVVSSLALITALALDATLRADASLEDEPAPTASAAPAALPKPEIRPAPAPAPVARRAPTPPLLVSARVGVSAGYESLLGAPRFGLLGQLDFRNDWSVRLLAHYERSTLEVDAGRAISVRVLGLQTSVCPLQLRAGDFSLYPCVAFDIGSLQAGGVLSDELPSVEDETLVWAALGPELRLAWEPAAPFWLELWGAEAVPLLPHRFDLENPRRLALDLHTLLVSGGFSGGVRFW